MLIGAQIWGEKRKCEVARTTTSYFFMCSNAGAQHVPVQLGNTDLDNKLIKMQIASIDFVHGVVDLYDYVVD